MSNKPSGPGGMSGMNNVSNMGGGGMGRGGMNMAGRGDQAQHKPSRMNQPSQQAMQPK